MVSFFKTKIAMALAMIALLSGGVMAEENNRTIRIIVPFNPGGSTDVTVRIVADEMSRSMGRSIVILNRNGGAGTIGLGDVARSEPDGTTYGVANISFAVNPFVIKNMMYDSDTDFRYVGMIGIVPLVVAVNTSVKVNTLEEFISYAKAHPGAIRLGSAGYLTSSHLAIELFTNKAGIDVTHVPFKGAESVTAAASGQIDAIISPVAVTLPFIKDGRLKALSVFAPTRRDQLSDLRTMTQVGFHGMEFGDWIGLVAPKGVASKTIDMMNAELVKALNSQNVRDKLANIDVVAYPSTPDEMKTFVKEQMILWKEIVKENNIKMQ